MLGIQNPYQMVVHALEAAYDSCAEAIHNSSDVPAGKGGNDIGFLALSAKNLLHEALCTAQQWQDSYDHHLNGTFGVRSDF